MPSKKVPELLIELYFTLDGAPWNFRSWQERTRIYHGLFPEFDKDLPAGWNRRNANDVLSWFKEYDGILNPKEKEKCARSSSKPGQEFFSTWVTKNWDKWGIHDEVCASLRERECHPFQLLRTDPTIKTFPEARFHLTKVTDDIARRLLGSELFPRGSRTVPSAYSELGFPTVFILRSWVRLKKKWDTDQKRFKTLATDAKAAYEEVVALPKPKKAALKKVIQAVAKWKELLDIYSIEKHLDEAEAMLTNLNGLLENVGVKVRKSSGSSTGTKPMKLILATQQDVDDVANLYQDLFRAPCDDEHLPVDADLFGDDDDDASDDHDDPPDEQAIGIDAVGNLDELTVRRRLGMGANNIPLLFFPLRHKAGLTAWDNPEAFTPDAVEPNVSHLHQDNGVLAALRSVTTKDPVSHPVTSSILVADEVGLGKTRLMIELMALVILTVFLNGAGRALPPAIRGRFLEDGQEFEDLPHLWVVPMTLTPQTVHAIMVCLQPHSVDIMVYECGKRGNEEFWSKTGPFKTSKQPLHRRIIITSHSSLREEFSWSHSPPLEKRDVPWEMPDPTRKLNKTLFGQRYATVTIDEAHEFRRTGPKFLSAFLVCQKAQLRILATGTPLHTNSSDVVSLGRLMQLPYFLSQSGLQKTRDDANQLVKSRPSAGDDRREFLALQIRITREYQAEIIGNMIRRTARTLDYLGRPLLPNLPGKLKIHLVVIPTEREKRITAAVAKKAKANANAATEIGIVPTRFYLEYRMISCYAKENPNGPDPQFSSLSEWEPIKSTKMDVAARVAVHYLSHDDIDDVFDCEGVVQYPSMPSVPAGERPLRTRKILIYVAWTSLMPIFLDVLRLFKLQFLFIDGQTTLEKRAEVIRQFLDPHGPRIFVFSSVGATGLNLTIADVVIFVDQPWSAQDEDQIEARACRQPQTKVVKCIHILIDGTADCLMNEIARSKDIMFKAFANKPLLEELQAIMSGKTVYGSEDDADHISDEDDDIEGPARMVRGQCQRASTKGKETAKAAPRIESSPPSSDDDIERPVKMVRKRGASAKGNRQTKVAPSRKPTGTHSDGPEDISTDDQLNNSEKPRNARSGSSRRRGEIIAQESQPVSDEEDRHDQVSAMQKAKRTSNVLKKTSRETTIAKVPIIKGSQNKLKVMQRAAVTVRKGRSVKSTKSSRNVSDDDEQSSESEMSIEYNQNASPPTPITSSRECRSRLRTHTATPTPLRESWRSTSMAHGDSSDGVDFSRVESDDEPLSEGSNNPDGDSNQYYHTTDNRRHGVGDSGGLNFHHLSITPSPIKKSKAKAQVPLLDEDNNGDLSPPSETTLALDHDGDYKMTPLKTQVAPTKRMLKERRHLAADNDGDLRMAPPNAQKSKLVKATQKNERVGSTRPATSPLQERPSKRARVGSLTALQLPPSGPPKKSSEPALSHRRKEEKRVSATTRRSTSSSTTNVPSIDFAKMATKARSAGRKSSGNISTPPSASTSISSPSTSVSEALEVSEPKKVGNNSRSGLSAIEQEAYRQAQADWEMLAQQAREPTPPIADRDASTTTHQQERGKSNPFAKRSDKSRTTGSIVKNTDSRSDASALRNADQGVSTTHQQKQGKLNPFTKNSSKPQATVPIVQKTSSRAEASATQQHYSSANSIANDSDGRRTNSPVVKRTYTGRGASKVAQTGTAAQDRNRSSSLAKLVTQTASTTLPAAQRMKTVGTTSRSSRQDSSPPRASHTEASSSRNEGRSTHRQSRIWADDDDSESDAEDNKSSLVTAQDKLKKWK
ncbi:hypothetical protein PM082_004119 [Marasmius tenuissimus]|nr:hypothetical protein PM082_004119 [Marasmius tenuissimus]